MTNNPTTQPLETLPAIDPLQFLSDDEIKEFEIDRRWDLTGTGDERTPTVSAGATLTSSIFIIHEHEVPEGMGEVILAVLPHCWRRQNPADPAAESWEQLDPALVAGFALFNVRVGSKQPLLVETDYNRPNISTAPQNRSRDRLAGSTWLTRDHPLAISSGLQTSLRTYFVPQKTKFQVLFQIMPNGNLPADGTWTVPTYPSTSQKRIDGAGALVTGMRMPQKIYEKLKIARRAGLLSRGR